MRLIRGFTPKIVEAMAAPKNVSTGASNTVDRSLSPDHSDAQTPASRTNPAANVPWTFISFIGSSGTSAAHIATAMSTIRRPNARAGARAASRPSSVERTTIAKAIRRAARHLRRVRTCAHTPARVDTRSTRVLSSVCPAILSAGHVAHLARRSRVGENEDVITLLDEEGVEHEFSIVDVLEVSDQRYAILQPLESGEEPDTAVIFRMEGVA